MEAKSRIRTVNGKKEIYDPVRKSYVPLSPEEMVRQAYLHYLMEEIHIPPIAVSIEKKVCYNSLTKRYDIVVAKPDGSILLLVGCKAETIKITHDTLSQLAMYNHTLQAKYMVLFNGKQQYVFQHTPQGIRMIDNLPDYSLMIREF